MTRTLRHVFFGGVLAASLAFSPAARAQDAAPAPADPAPPSAGGPNPAVTATAGQAPTTDDSAFRAAEPDFTVISLPSGLPLGLHKSAFRVTHRFTRPLGQGDFGDLAADFFGLDTGAQIGLEYRFGIIPHGQIGIHRTSDRTIEFFSQYEAIRRSSSFPFSVSAWLSVEGTNNFQDEYTPSIGAIIGLAADRRASLYVEPMYVHHANVFAAPGDDSAFLIGVGGRFRIHGTVYLAGEAAPRVAGFDGGVMHGSFAIEKRVGGHVFQLNFSDSFATTMGQIARGGPDSKDWFLGFNISRKFY